MSEKWQAEANTNCPSYRGVCLTEVSVNRELTMVLSTICKPGEKVWECAGHLQLVKRKEEFNSRKQTACGVS